MLQHRYYTIAGDVVGTKLMETIAAQNADVVSNIGTQLQQLASQERITILCTDSLDLNHLFRKLIRSPEGEPE